MGMYACDFAGGGGNAAFKPTLVIQIGQKGMEYGSKKSNKGYYGVLSHKLVGWCNSIKNRAEGYAGMLFFVKIERYLAEEIIMIYQDFSSKIEFIFLRELISFYRQ